MMHGQEVEAQTAPGVISPGESQMSKIVLCFPKPRRTQRVDDRRVLSGLVFVQKHCSRGRAASTEYGQQKTIDDRFIRWSRAATAGEPDAGMNDAPHPKAHRGARSS
jgi:putative transposase